MIRFQLLCAMLLTLLPACAPHAHAEGTPATATAALTQAPTQVVPRPTPAVSSIHLELGMPTAADPSNDYLIVVRQYATSYNHQKNGPNWVAWELNKNWIGGQDRYKGQFIPETTLPTGWYRVTHADYTSSGYSRGHVLPSKDRSTSAVDNEATFHLIQILPQTQELNVGPWEGLEKRCRVLAKNDGRELFIVGGPIWGKTPKTIGHGVSVPDFFWKIVVVLEPGQGAKDVTADTRVIAVIMPNVSDGVSGHKWPEYVKTVKEIEARTGYTFFNQIPENVRTALKSKVDQGR